LGWIRVHLRLFAADLYSVGCYFALEDLRSGGVNGLGYAVSGFGFGQEEDAASSSGSADFGSQGSVTAGGRD
jgi:hypothetical protein